MGNREGRMGSKTKIEWTATVNADGSVTPGATWNPIRARRRSDGKLGWACQKVSQGCKNCYAESLNLRLGTGRPFTGIDDAEVELFLDEEMLLRPLRWRRPRKIFVCSMTDLFADFVPAEWIDRIFAVMHLSPRHTFQVLTKRAARMNSYLDSSTDNREEVIGAAVRELTGGASSGLLELPLPNVWLGVSAENQETADERIPLLRETRAAVRFVSAEPLLSGLDLSKGGAGQALGISWLIIGGESGPIDKVRPMDIEWVRDIVRQCREAGVPCFVKQLGRFPVYYKEVGSGKGSGYVPLSIRDGKGGDPAEWDEDLRIREWPA